MWKFVTVQKRVEVGLPDPATASTPQESARMAAVNDVIAESMTTPDKSTTKRGVKRKRQNNTLSPVTRAKIAKFAVDNGNSRAASHFSAALNISIGESSVRFMKKKYLAAKKITKAADVRELVPERRGRPLLLGQLDELVKSHLIAIRNSGGIVNNNIVLATARGIVLHENRSLLAEKGGPISLTTTWAESLLERMGFVKRKGTKAARKLPENFDEQKDKFISDVGGIVADHDIPPELVLNFDQTGVKIVPVSNWTLAAQGSKQVAIVGLEDKREITALLGSTASGDLLPPQVIYQGTTDKCHAHYTFPDDWHVTHTASHWSTEETMIQYVDEVLVPYTKRVKREQKLPVRQKSLAIFDVFAAHRCQSFLDLLKKRHFLVRFVPAGCTGELQPLDLSVNADFKVTMKKQFTTWYADSVAANLKEPDTAYKRVDLRISVMKPIHARWVVTTFDTLKKDREIVLRGWRQAGLLPVIANS